MKKFILVAINIGLGISAVTTAISAAYAINPSMFNYAMDFIGMTPQEVTTFSQNMGIITGLGLLSKSLNKVVNKENLAMKYYYEKQLKLQEEEHQAKMKQMDSRLKNQEDYTAKAFERLSKTIGQFEKQIVLLTEYENIRVEHQLNLSDKIVSPEVKQKYRVLRGE